MAGAWEVVLRTVPIVHVYGQLGNYSTHEDNSMGLSIVKSSAAVSKGRIGRAMREINLIHERAEQEKRLLKVRNLIARDNRIFFLGFGYDETNISMIRGSALELARDRPVIGSAYHLRRGEIVMAKRNISENITWLAHHWTGNNQPIVPLPKDWIRMANPNDDALEVLREYADLLV